MHHTLISIILLSITLFFSACGGSSKTEAPALNSSKIDKVETPTQEKNTTKKEPVVVIEVPTQILIESKIFLIGDSTVTIPRSVTAQDGRVGWGDRLSTYMKKPENFFNVAVGGASSRSYKEVDGVDWGKTKQLILDTNTSAGAYLLIQLGHNDIARDFEDAMDTSNKTTMPGRNNSYYNELKVYIDWGKSHDITPVLVTPLEGVNQYEGLISLYDRTYGNYAQTVRELAEDEDVLLIDLQQKSWDVFTSYEDDTVLQATFTVEGLHDRVHFSAAGASIVAGWVSDFICDLNDTTFCAQFKE